jgi:hypothetical protein
MHQLNIGLPYKNPPKDMANKFTRDTSTVFMTNMRGKVLFFSWQTDSTCVDASHLTGDVSYHEPSIDLVLGILHRRTLFLNQAVDDYVVHEMHGTTDTIFVIPMFEEKHLHHFNPPHFHFSPTSIPHSLTKVYPVFQARSFQTLIFI